MKDKKKNIFPIILIILLVFLGVIIIYQKTQNYGSLSEEEIEALNLAINDEYKAKATYEKVIDKFGEVKPFTNIINAEEQHIKRLESIYNEYNIEIPDDNWYEKVPEFDSIQLACQAGVQAEIENADLYDELKQMTNNSNILSVFNALQSASRNNHLPAFQNCA